MSQGVQQAIWKDLDEIINTTNPELKRFLGGILMSRHAEIEGARKITDHIKMSGDLAGIFAEEEKLTQSLDALLFINDVFEAYGFSKVAFQKTPAGKYFAQAKVTGEAIADFSASIYSWYKIDRLSKENEEIARKIEALSSRVDAVLTEMSCLKVCLRDYFENCQATCTRTPKFPVPPPPIR